MVLYAGIGLFPLVIIAARSASLIFCTSAELQSRVFIAGLPLPSAPWHPAHLALNVASAAATSALAGLLTRNVPTRSAAVSAAAPRFFMVVCMLLLPHTSSARRRMLAPHRLSKDSSHTEHIQIALSIARRISPLAKRWPRTGETRWD